MKGYTFEQDRIGGKEYIAINAMCIQQCLTRPEGESIGGRLFLRHFTRGADELEANWGIWAGMLKLYLKLLFEQ